MFQELSVHDFYQMIQGGSDYTLVDVRRDDELALSKYPEPFLHIELSELTERANEISHEYPIILACRSGGRSAKAAAILAQHGFKNLYNLTGGILAWADEITPQLARG